MDEESSSWVRRTKFSHTVCHRLDSTTLRSVSLRSGGPSFSSPYKDPTLRSMLTAPSPIPAIPPEGSSRSGVAKQRAPSPLPAARSEAYSAMHVKSARRSLSPLPVIHSSVLQLPALEFKIEEKKPEPKKKKPQSSLSEPMDKSKHSSLSPKKSSKSKRRSLSPLPIKYLGSMRSFAPFEDSKSSNSNRRAPSPVPSTPVSGAFKEAISEAKRFSTPTPRRISSDRGVIGKFLNRDGGRSFNSRSPASLSSKKSTGKSKGGKKETSWAKYFDPAGGRVTAVETAEEWMVDLSKLYLGQKFAAGAHSRLYRAFYKEQAVAVKMITQPDPDDDDDDRTMASRLEKQFIREVTILSRLHHRNVLKIQMAVQGPPGIMLLKPSHKKALVASRFFSPSRKLGHLGSQLANGSSVVTPEFPKLVANYSGPYHDVKPDDKIKEDKDNSSDSFDGAVDDYDSGSDNDDPFLMTDEERQKLRRKIRDVIDNAPDVEEEQDLEERKRKMKTLLANYPLVVEEDDPDWPDDAEGWGFNLDQFFNKITIKNTKKNDDDDSYDSDKEIVWQDDNYIRPIRDITSEEWDDTVFKDFNPLVILVHNRYKRPHENERARAQLESAVQMFWQTGLPSPRCVAIDAVVEEDLVSILKVSGYPEVLFTKAGKILHRDKVVRTADEWSKMMAFFYYKAVRPSCVDKSVGQDQEKIPSL